MTTRIEKWWAGLDNRWRATLRTVWQAILPSLLLFLLALISVAEKWITGATAEEVWDGLLSAARFLALGLLAVASGFITWFMNRGNKGAQYEPSS